MNLELIKKQLEDEKSFQHWSDEVGLSFNDFTVYEHIDSDKWKVIKRGSKEIGSYHIFIMNGVIDSISYDLSNETARQNRLRKIGK